MAYFIHYRSQRSMLGPRWLFFAFQKLVLRSWWVYLFGLVCITGYEVGMQKITLDRLHLRRAISESEKNLHHLKAIQVDLQEQIIATGDTRYVERMLKRDLGVVADGETKIYFREAL